METTITTVQIVSMLIGIVLPVLVGLVTTKVTEKRVKAVLLALLAAVTGFLTELLHAMNTQAEFGWDQAALAWLGTFITAVTVHFGFMKPVGVTDKAQASLVTTKRVQ